MAEQTLAPAKPAENGLRRRDPWDMLETLREDMERLWGQFWPLPMIRPERRPAATTGTAWTPRLDVFEKNGNLVVKAELPGVTKDDIKVNLVQDGLEIHGERKTESEVKEEDYYRMERSYGSFYRRLPLGFDIKADKIKATFTDGVLEVTIPKPAAVEPAAKQIKVS
jgi:HSP20 family protein